MNLSVLPFQKNKISFNLFLNFNDADLTTIKNYKLKLLKNKDLTDSDKLLLASLNPPISQMSQTMMQQLENDRTEEYQDNQANSSYSSTMALIKETEITNKKSEIKKKLM